MIWKTFDGEYIEYAENEKELFSLIAEIGGEDGNGAWSKVVEDGGNPVDCDGETLAVVLFNNGTNTVLWTNGNINTVYAEDKMLAH